MRWYIFSILLLFGACRKPVSKDPLAGTITKEEASRDLKLLRELLEDAHPSLTEYISGKRINHIFDSLSRSIPGKITIRDFFTKITFITNEIGCSHTAAELPPILEDTLYKRKLFFPFPTILLNDKLYINTDRDLPHGTRLLSINGITVTEILDSLAIYNPVEGYHRSIQKNAAAADFGFEYFLRFGCPDIFELSIQDTTGKMKKIFFEPITLAELYDRHDEKYYFDAEDVNYSFYINEKEKYAQLRLTDFSMGSSNREAAFENFLKNSFELLSHKKNIRHLIIDLRGNTGGSLYNCFLLHSYLSKNDFAEYQNVFSEISKIPYENYLVVNGDLYDTSTIKTMLREQFLVRTSSGYAVPDSLIEVWKPNKHTFGGSIYIITSFSVTSAASYFTLLTKNNSSAKVVGMETTGGAYSGNGFKLLKYQLPFSNIRVLFPYARLLYSHNEAKSGQGIIPDYIVPDTYSSFKKNEDLQLNFIIDSILSKNR